MDLSDLTLEQRKELREALMSAFPQYSQLELMVGDELGGNLNSITQGQPSHELVVRDLIAWAEARGRVQELLNGALNANPGNPKLKKFAASVSQGIPKRSNPGPASLGSFPSPSSVVRTPAPTPSPYNRPYSPPPSRPHPPNLPASPGRQTPTQQRPGRQATTQQKLIPTEILIPLGLIIGGWFIAFLIGSQESTYESIGVLAGIIGGCLSGLALVWESSAGISSASTTKILAYVFSGGVLGVLIFMIPTPEVKQVENLKLFIKPFLGAGANTALLFIQQNLGWTFLD